MNAHCSVNIEQILDYSVINKEIEKLATNSIFFILLKPDVKPLIFKSINAARAYSQSLNYQWFTPSGCENIGFRKISIGGEC